MSKPDNIEAYVPLAPMTTIKLGGPARQFVRCHSEEELISALEFARGNNLRVHVLSGGSNTIFADEGFDGLVVKIEIAGVEYADAGEYVLTRVGAGENWDGFVERSITRGLGGLETMSGIPGSVGATPMQNVGAYGQDVSAVIAEVEALDTHSLKKAVFPNEECEFSYRSSIFKERERGRYIITQVTYRLPKRAVPTVIYPDIVEQLVGEKKLGSDPESLLRVRRAVLAVRRRKSMVLNRNDRNTRSCGSFFLNTVLTPAAAEEVARRARTLGIHDPPRFTAGDFVKIPAAWMVENAGFHRGYRYDGVGISENHPLALVNYDGTTSALLTLAGEIQTAVKEKFGVDLTPEPDIVR